MAIIKSLKKYFLFHLKKKGRIIEVTVKHYYTVPEYEAMTDAEIKKVWFEDFSLGSSHAYRDSSEIGGGASEVLKVKFLTIADAKKVKL